jgi:DMSO/TMAO reductase YedYZ molybdopterin-dependent catalytic subunit
VLDVTPPFRKSIPIERAMDPDTIVAISMNDAPLPLLNGYPARLIVPGWVGTYWMKHLTTIEVSTKPLASFWRRMPTAVQPACFRLTTHSSPRRPRSRSRLQRL